MMKRLIGLPILLAAALSARAACGPFIPNVPASTPIPSGAVTYAMTGAVADFNSDGSPDVAFVGRSFDRDTVVLFGTNSGRLISRPLPNVPNGGGAKNVIAADFNGDGIPDLAFADDSTFMTRLSLGDSTFSTGQPVAFASGDTIRGLAAGDFDGDGRMDLLIGSDKGITVYSGRGDGTFAKSTFTPIGAVNSELAVGDFNGDGKLDVAVASFANSTLTIALGNGDGSFTAGQQKTFVNDEGIALRIVAADFNGDGRLDLAVANSEGLRILPGAGDGTFRDAAADPVGWKNTTLGQPVHLVAADLNGDGFPDLVVSADVIGVFTNSGGQFGAPDQIIRSVGGKPLDAINVFAADINADGFPDLIELDNSGVANVFINPCRSPLILRTTADVFVAGDPIALNLYDANGPATTLATFYDRATHIGVGNGSMSTAFSTAGSHALTAMTSDGTTTAPLLVFVHAKASSITLSQESTRSPYGRGFHLAGDVKTDTGELPKLGNVDILNKGTVLTSVPVSNGHYDVLFNPPAGVYDFTARYDGARTWPRSDPSPSIHHIVDITSTTMTSNDSAARACQPKFPPILNGTFGIFIQISAPTGTPTGNVTLSVPQLHYTDVEPLSDSGVAGFGFGRVPAGTYAWVASYPGDGGYAPNQLAGTVTVPECPGRRRAVPH